MIAPASSLLTGRDLARAGSGDPAARLVLDAGQQITLRLARLHEFCGPARDTLALMTAARALARGDIAGPLYWISGSWQQDALHAAGILPFLDPARLLFLQASRPADMLWAMEEILRSGVVPVVVADLRAPPGLTQVRRLHLAAETGAAAGGIAPIGLILTPQDGGAPGVETRWHMAPAHAGPDPTRGRWRLERRRARMEPPRGWYLHHGPKGAELNPSTDPQRHPTKSSPDVANERADG
ncbi:hypothetical protein [Pseudooceanicola algae]|uniref:Protein ImuA n=1 Tax=Pseudooceanicola algae TaxID=1537215 RepID=A0A418SCG7_9RHOB|nr:hypothetical protein [Pseudooceanicola algae]QPM90102.1 hypothetical protein PSAL_013360 [Pseudooceanicola algae]